MVFGFGQKVSGFFFGRVAHWANSTTLSWQIIAFSGQVCFFFFFFFSCHERKRESSEGKSFIATWSKRKKEKSYADEEEVKNIIVTVQDVRFDWCQSKRRQTVPVSEIDVWIIIEHWDSLWTIIVHRSQLIYLISLHTIWCVCCLHKDRERERERERDK